MSATVEQKNFFTATEANARLPLLRLIVRDVAELAFTLKSLHQDLIRLQSSGSIDPDQEKEMDRLADELDRRQQTMNGYEAELEQLGVVLKDDLLGLVDFPAWHEGREVCLCWKFGEPEVAHWHEVDAGYGGRHSLKSMTAFARGAL